MKFHICELEYDFADAVRIVVELLIRAAQYDLVEELPNKLVAFFEAFRTALRTQVLYLRAALTT